jgi:hypothetical protein
MKTKLVLLAMVAATCSLKATTITAGGGTGGAQFYTSAGSILTNLNSSFSAGTWNGTAFTSFGAADPTPIAISTVASLAGRWSAGFTDNNNTTAGVFNGLPVWFRVTTTADGGGTAYFSGASVFPNANGGVGDSLTVSSVTLTTLGAGSADFSRAYSASDSKIIVGVIPEPSAALLGAVGALGLLRRRRN